MNLINNNKNTSEKLDNRELCLTKGGITMKFLSNTSNHNGVRIHYLDSSNKADHSLIPIVICPGLSETAEEYEDSLEYLLPRRAIVLSFRGRGESETPQMGYHLEGHIQDIESVIKTTGITYFHLFGFSRGVSYALGYARKNVDQIASIIVEDYPSEHKEMPKHWPDEYLNDYLLPYNRLENIREEAVRGIQRESIQEKISFHFERPVLVIRGLLEDSLIKDDDLKRYTDQFKHMEVVECSLSGHAIRNTEKDKLYMAVKQFIA